jgi:starvation-inducible DNA-binding protein
MSTKTLKNIKKQVMEDDSVEDIMEEITGSEQEMEEPEENDDEDEQMSSTSQEDPSVDTLIASLKTYLADSFSVYVKASYFHWNIEGPDFFQYHELLGKIYDDIQGTIDPIAENIRKLGGYAPGSFGRFQELTAITEASKIIPPAMVMFKELHDDIEKLIASNERSYELAEINHEHGISDFLAGRDGMLEKWRWFLRSTLANR